MSELATYSRDSSGEKQIPFGQAMSTIAAFSSFVAGSRR